jgi:CheY-like chemotaxis protein
MSNMKNKPSTVLIVEDSPTQLMHLQHLIAGQGIETICVQSGEEGLHNAQIHLPNLIVLDIELPGMDGLQLCKLLSENRYTSMIPIVLFTHLNDTETARYGFLAGAIKYIPKDEYADDELLEVLRTKGLIASELNMA